MERNKHVNMLETVKETLKETVKEHEKTVLMAYITAVGSRTEQELAVFWNMFDVFGPDLVSFVIGGGTW